LLEKGLSGKKFKDIKHLSAAAHIYQL
jgi:hypothetical protein